MLPETHTVGKPKPARKTRRVEWRIASRYPQIVRISRQLRTSRIHLYRCLLGERFNPALCIGYWQAIAGQSPVASSTTSTTPQ